MEQMTYQEVMKEETVTISQKRAISEVKQHSASVAEFFSEVGSKEVYTAKEVLQWLGY